VISPLRKYNYWTIHLYWFFWWRTHMESGRLYFFIYVWIFNYM